MRYVLGFTRELPVHHLLHQQAVLGLGSGQREVRG